MPPVIYYCYANADEAFREELEKHLSLLQRSEEITSWYPRLVLPGADAVKEISAALDTASIILLLVSSDFLASNYCYSVEMKKALEKQSAGEAYVVPILSRSVDLHGAPFEYLQSLPRNNIPVVNWPNQDEAFLDIVTGIRIVIEALHRSGDAKPLLPLQRWETTINRHGVETLSSIDDRNRERLLRRVRTFWITGVFEKSLYHATLVELGMDSQPDAVENPWRLSMQETNQQPYPFLEKTHITEVYDEADGELLILGEPGSGKTTLLLELTKNLLRRAGQDQSHPIPIVFNLSSWAEKRQALPLWLVEELYTKYQVPRKIASSLINADQILLLLDGLDEVTPLYRSACVEAINAYRRLHNLASVVVCCRKAEYLSQPVLVQLYSAVNIQPLTMQQVSTYLERAGKEVEVIRIALRRDPDFQQLVKTPLMLSVLTLAYHGRDIGELLSEKSLEAQRKQVLTAYIDRTLQRRRAERVYTKSLTIRWLSSLARQMISHNQTVFYIERMQPSWLTRDKRNQYYNMVTWLIYGLVFALLSGLFGWLRGGNPKSHFGLSGSLGTGLLGLLSGRRNGDEVLGWMGGGLLGTTAGGLAMGLIFLLVGGLVIILAGRADALTGQRESTTPTKVPIQHILMDVLIRSLTGGLIFGLVGGLVLLPFVGLAKSASQGLADALIGISSVGLLRSLVLSLDRGSDKALWSFPRVNIIEGLIDGLVVGFLSGLVYGCTTGLVVGPIGGCLYGLIYGIIICLVFWLSGRMGGGLSGRAIAEIRPAEIVAWTWKNITNSLFSIFGKRMFAGLAFGVFSGLTFGLIAGFAYTWDAGLRLRASEAPVHGIVSNLVRVFFNLSSNQLNGFTYGLSYGLVYGIIMGLVGGSTGGIIDSMSRGWSSEMLDEEKLLQPNQGIYSSLRNSVLVGLFIGALSGLLSGVIISLVFASIAGLDTYLSIGEGLGLLFGILFMVIFGIRSGGLAAVQHFFLRWLIWRTRDAPWNYPSFLDYAAECILLRKVGGGYIFVHRMLLDYFANMDVPSHSEQASFLQHVESENKE